MKKILFLLLVCLIKLNAYEYLVYYNQSPSSDASDYEQFATNLRNKLEIKITKRTGNISYSSNKARFLNILGGIKRNIAGTNYIKKEEFINYYKNDLLFLNDLYITENSKIAFLNFLYNDTMFSNSNYIEYNDYELLYNSDGLAVESIVNGKWAGLYDGPDKTGYLYNEKGDLLYKNGVPVSFFEKINDKLLKKFKINLESIFIKKIFYPLLVLIFACVIFRSVIRMAFKAFLIRFYDKKIGQLEKRREKIENA